MNRLARSVSDILLGNLFLRILGVIFTPLIVRALSKAEYGEFIGLLAIFQAISRFATGGLFQATNKFASEVDTNKRGVVLGGSLILSTVYSAVTAAIILFSVWWFGPIAFGDTIFAYISVFVILFRNPFIVLRGFLYGVHQEQYSQGIKIVQKTIYSFAGLALAYGGFGVVSILISHATSYFLAITSVAIIKYRVLKLNLRTIYINRHTIRQIGSFGMINVIGFMSALLLYKTDIILIRHFLGDSPVADYQAALFPAELVWIVPAAIQGALLQNTAGNWSDGQIENVSKKLQMGVKYGSMSLILFGVGLFVLAEDFLFIYFGSNYVTSTRLLQILLFGSFFYGVNRLYIPVLQAIGELKRQQATNVIALLINIILNVILIPKLGTIGAAVATSLSYSSVIVGSVLILRNTPVQPPSAQLVIKLLSLFITFVVLYAVPVSTVSFSPLLSLLVFPPLGLIIFAVLSHVLDLFTVEQARDILNAGG